MLKSGLTHWGILRMEVMLPTLDWMLGGLLHPVGSSEGGGVAPLSEWGSSERSLFLLYETDFCRWDP